MANIIKRIITYIIGLLLLALGVAFSINSGLGVSPVNSLPYVISLIRKTDLGVTVTAVFIFYILVQVVILRKDFKWMNLTQIIFSTLFGYFVDLAKFIVGDFTIPGYLGSLVMLAFSIVIIALGITLYVNAGLVNMPMEGMVLAINQKLLPHKEFSQVKVIVDTVVVVVGVVLSLVFLKGLHGIREGTVLAALFVGRVMTRLHPHLVPKLQKILNK